MFDHICFGIGYGMDITDALTVINFKFNLINGKNWCFLEIKMSFKVFSSNNWPERAGFFRLPGCLLVTIWTCPA